MVERVWNEEVACSPKRLPGEVLSSLSSRTPEELSALQIADPDIIRVVQFWSDVTVSAQT